MGIRECSNRSNWGRLRNNDKFEEFVFISANTSNVHSSIPIGASKNKIPLRGHVDTLSCVPRTTI